MKKILITTSSFGKLDNTLLEDLKAKQINYVLNPFGRKLTEKEIYNLITEHQPDGIIAGVEPLTENVLSNAKNLKVISRCGIGMDSVDLDAAQKLGIKVSNTPDAPTIPVAELTIGMILTLLRKIHISDSGIRADQWIRPMGNLLYQKTVGLIGCGRIGTHTAKLLSAFGCKIIGHDPFVQAHEVITMLEFKTVLAESDIVSLHIPYSKDTHHLFDGTALNAMKPGAYFINASRGGLVDEMALYDALVSGHLAGAALDCFENEPYKGNLAELDSVLLTGHIGSYAVEGRNMQEKQALQNLLSALG